MDIIVCQQCGAINEYEKTDEKEVVLKCEMCEKENKYIKYEIKK